MYDTHGPTTAVGRAVGSLHLPPLEMAVGVAVLLLDLASAQIKTLLLVNLNLSFPIFPDTHGLTELFPCTAKKFRL